MRFLNPLFLYGLFVMAIPIIIHLFHFRKIRKVYFSNTRFLKKVKDESARRRKLKHYLILASRLLFLFFLVMAFAQPFIPAKDNEAAGAPTVIYLDNSYSMSNEVQEDLPALDQAVDYVSALLDIMPETARFRLLTNDFLPSSNVMRSKREIEEELTELDYSSMTRSYEDIQQRIRDFNENDDRLNVFWISDFQSSSAPKTNTLSFDSSEFVQVIPLAFRSVKNISVDSLYLDNPLMIGDEKLKLHTVLRNTGSEEVRDLIVKIFIDDIQSATGSVTIPANGEAELGFDISVSMKTDQRGRISIEEFPVTFDNDFYFALTRPEKISVLEIKSESAATPVEQVYGNKTLFDFASAMDSNLDYNRISVSDLVVLNGLERIDGPLITTINRYIQDGGRVMLIPSVKPDLSSYRKLLGASDLQVRDSAAAMSLATPDFDNPFFHNIFEEKTDRMAMPRSIPVLSWTSRGTNILSFANGAPYLTERQGQGRLYLFSSPVLPPNDGFSRHALFVPVMYKIAASGMGEERKLYRYTDQSSFIIRQDTVIDQGLYRLEQGEVEIVPQQSIRQGDVYLDVPANLLQAGYYNLTLDKSVLSLLAFDYSPAESDLKQLESSGLNDLFQGAHVTVSVPEDTQNFQGQLKEKFLGINLWKYMVLAALLSLLIEVALIRFMP